MLEDIINPFAADASAELYAALESLTSNISQLENTGKLEGEEYSVESLQDVLTQISANTNLFVTKLKNLFTIGNQVYITEYQTWSAKNAMRIGKVERMSTESVAGQLIDIPSGMTGTYGECATMLNHLVETLDIFAVLRNVSHTADCILISINQGSNSCEGSLASAIAQLAVMRNKTDISFNKLMAMFNFDATDHAVSVSFNSQFTDVEALAQCRKTLANTDKKIVKSSSLVKESQQLETRVNRCVDYLVDKEPRNENEYKPTPKFVKQLTEYLSDAEHLINTYGVAITVYMAITHNLTFVYKKLGGW